MNQTREVTMSQFIQFLNGYGLIWIPSLAALIALTVLLIRRSRVRWWALWTTCVVGVGLGLSVLPTAAGTEITPAGVGSEGGTIAATHEAIDWQSADSIENAVRASNGKPTLVEFYTDYGIG
jgi:hypothetical protein